ncbi:MAG: hypothetical protein AABX02_02645, partial [archaeon]
FQVIGTETYHEELSKWPKSDREAAEKLPPKLAEDPHVGQLLIYPSLREKRIEGRRIYFLVYDDLTLVLLVATSGKKDQQETIDHIKDQFVEYRKLAEELIKPTS